MSNLTQPQLTDADLAILVESLKQLLSSEHGAACLDDEEDLSRVAEGVASWLLADKLALGRTSWILPRAEHYLGFDICDQFTGERIVRLVLDKTWDMTDFDYTVLQNFFWTTIGRAIKENPEIRRRLEGGGVRIDTGGGA